MMISVNYHNVKLSWKASSKSVILEIDLLNHFYYFRTSADKCKETPTNCDCWNKAADDIKKVKDCMIGLKSLLF